MKDKIQRAVILVITCISTVAEAIKLIAGEDDGGERNGSSS